MSILTIIVAITIFVFPCVWMEILPPLVWEPQGAQPHSLSISPGKWIFCEILRIFSPKLLGQMIISQIFQNFFPQTPIFREIFRNFSPKLYGLMILLVREITSFAKKLPLTLWPNDYFPNISEFRRCKWIFREIFRTFSP